MTLASIVRTRLALWREACDGWGFEAEPPFTRVGVKRLPAGLVAFRAVGAAVQATEEGMTLSVVEAWAPGVDHLGDRRLEAEGCHLILLSWHLQAGSRLGTGGAERLDVVFEPDEAHPRIHRHPYGEPNPVRQPSDLPPPHAWLHRVDEQLGWLLSTKLAQSSEQD